MRPLFRLFNPVRPGFPTLLLFWATISHIAAQQLPICQGGEELAHSCSTACILCDLDGYSNTTIQVTPGDPPPGFCTFVVHNIGWVGFIAGSTDLTFDVEVFPCTLGNSIEMGIYEAPNCMNSQLVGTCNTEMIEGNTYSFNNTVPLNPGCVYFLVFDNNGPASCPFTVTVTSGSATAPNPGPTPTPVGPTEICPGAVVTYSIPPVFGTCEYTWTAPAGCLINGSPSPVSIQGDAGASVEITFGNSAGNVCVETGNVCAGYTDACLPVTIKTIPPTTLPPVSICNGASLEWIDGEFYSSTQLLTTTLQSWLGCDSVVNQQLIVRPPITNNLGTINSCQGECVTVGGVEFCASGFYQVHLTSYLDCDSTLLFSLNQLPVNAVIAPPDTLDCLQDTVVLNANASTSNASYAWYNSQGMLLGTNTTLDVSNPGMYLFVVIRTSGNQTCRDSAWATVVSNILLPMVTAQGDTLNCQGDSLQLNGMTNLSTAIFSWAGPGIDSTNQHLEDPWLDVPGTYILQVTNPVNGCEARDTTTVESMGLTPDLSVPDKDTVSCGNPVAWLVASSSVPGVAFLWIAPDSTLTHSDSVQANQNGLWIALATAPGGCVNMDTALLLIDTLRPAALATGGVLDCSGNPIPIHGSSPDSTAIFSWTGPGNFSSNVPDTLVTISGNYILTVAGQNGCTTTATAQVLANTNVPNLTANTNAANGTITCVQTSVDLFANSTSPGAVITWTGPGGYSAMGNFADAALPGLYTATATTPNGCQSSVNLNIPIDTTAPVVSVQGDTMSCNHSQAFLFGYCTDIDGVYLWSGPGIGPNNAMQQNPIVTQPGIYDLTVTSLGNACTASAQTSVGFDIALPSLSAAPPSVLTCTTTSVPISASSVDSGVVFLWTGPNGFSSSNDSIQVNVPGNYSVVATGLNGCRDSLLLTVPEDVAPPGLTATGGTINCAQSSVQLNGTTNTSGVVFQWTGPNGFNSMAQSPVTTVPGTYVLTGTAPNGCSTTAQTQVLADITPPVLTVSSNVQTLNCLQTVANLQAQSNLPSTQFQWSLLGTVLGGNANLMVQAPGTYLVTGTAPNGCTTVDSLIIQQDIATPNVFAQGNTLFCNTQNVTISGGSNTPGASLKWTGPGNFTSVQTMPSVSVPGNYTLTVTAPNGCTASAVAIVLPDATVPDLSVQPAATLTCTVASVPLIANSGTAGAVFQWMGPGNFSANGAMVQAQTPGTYTVQVTAPNGCSTAQTLTVPADTLAPVATAFGGTLTCSNTTVLLDGNSDTNGTIYAWSGPNNFTAMQADVAVSQAGTYQLSLTAPNGCTGTATAQVLQDTASPNLSLSTGIPLTCAQTTSDILANTTTPGVTWSWTGPGNFTANTPNITVSLPGNYFVTITAANGCTNDASAAIAQNIAPPTALVTGGVLTCIQPSLVLNGQSADPSALFHWAGPGSFIFDGPSPTVNLSGLYSLTVTGSNGCTATASATVSADQTSPAFSLSGETITCINPTVSGMVGGFSSGTVFNWSGPGGFQQTGALVAISAPGSYQVTAQGTNGCTATQSLVIPADLAAPQIDLQGGVLNCRDTLVLIQAEVSPPGATLSWSGPQQNLPSQADVWVEFPGLYTLTATAANGCTAESVATVDQIVPVWSIELGPDQTVWEGAFVSVHALTDLPGQDIADIFWTPAFNCTSCLDQVFKAKDSVFLQITIEDENGCLKSDALQINVRKRGAVYVPNVFSPDDDGNNDVFEVFSGNPATLVRSLQIFDRWGELVFSQKDFHPGESSGKWNGTHRGNLLRPAVFVWVLELEYEDGSHELLSGDVLLKL